MGSVWVVLHVHRHGEDLWAFANEADAEAKVEAIEADAASYRTGFVDSYRLEVRDESD